jgi:hypothetical protein
MRVTVQHRSDRGLFGPRFALNLTFEFTNEERVVIRERGLTRHVLDLSPGYLASSETLHGDRSVNVLRIGGWALFVGGLSILVLTAFSGLGNFIAALLIFGGPALFWYAIYAGYRVGTANRNEITLGYVLSNPRVVVRSFTPADGKLMELKIMSRVADLKKFVSLNVQMGEQRTYEF